VNDEENRLEDAGALEAAGLRIHSMSPRSVAAVGPAVRALCEELGMGSPPEFAEEAWQAWLTRTRGAPIAAPVRAATLVWRRPWMALGAQTYGSSVLEVLGVHNVFTEADGRYPEVALDELSERAPDVVLLPDEPYVFREHHAREVASATAPADVRLLSGRDLFWWGVRTPGACARLASVIRP
jgi:hypothetical protein